MDIASLAQQYAYLSVATAAGIGLLQGAVMARGIRSRFPGLKARARPVSAALLILFAVSGLANIAKFASPPKIDFERLAAPSSGQEAYSLALHIIGLDEGFGAAVLVFVSVSLIVIFRAARLHPVSRYFIFAVSLATFGVFVVSRATGYVPDAFEVLLYAAYQFGLAAGVFAVSRRRSPDAPG